MPYADAAFDLVICADVLEHVNNPAQVLAEINRVLVTGGRAYVSATNRFAYSDPYYKMEWLNWVPRWMSERMIAKAGREKKNGLLKDRQGLSDMHSMTWGQFRRLANKAGFSIRDLLESQPRDQGLASLSRGRLGRFYRVIDRLKLSRWGYEWIHRPLFSRTFRAKLVKEPRGELVSTTIND